MSTPRQPSWFHTQILRFASTSVSLFFFHQWHLINKLCSNLFWRVPPGFDAKAPTAKLDAPIGEDQGHLKCMFFLCHPQILFIPRCIPAQTTYQRWRGSGSSKVHGFFCSPEILLIPRCPPAQPTWGAPEGLCRCGSILATSVTPTRFFGHQIWNCPASFKNALPRISTSVFTLLWIACVRFCLQARHWKAVLTVVCIHRTPPQSKSKCKKSRWLLCPYISSIIFLLVLYVKLISILINWSEIGKTNHE